MNTGEYVNVFLVVLYKLTIHYQALVVEHGARQVHLLDAVQTPNEYLSLLRANHHQLIVGRDVLLRHSDVTVVVKRLVIAPVLVGRS